MSHSLLEYSTGSWSELLLIESERLGQVARDKIEVSTSGLSMCWETLLVSIVTCKDESLSGGGIVGTVVT
jgi:hypothetical protein